MDFSFLGGSMGSVVGEKLTRMIEAATEKGLPVIIISTSGGARMYEGMFSLMQMAKTCAALAYHAKAKLPYISVLGRSDHRGCDGELRQCG
jgi:acetyl-CoA carboxylase carboxyl transferase subunit beta